MVERLIYGHWLSAIRNVEATLIIVKTTRLTTNRAATYQTGYGMRDANVLARCSQDFMAACSA
jgi:hypothetical protein